MSLFALFVEGLLSFLSPCVLPLVPLYMSYLSIDAKEVDKKGNVKYKTSKVFLMTVFFVLGISVVFIILALSLNAIKPIISQYSSIISLIGGLIIIIFGLHQTGIINITLFNKEKKIDSHIDLSKMTYFKAFLLGFLFSFAWTPCIGPMLSSAIIIASTSSYGALYILVYALGFIIPFLITGLFTSYILNFIKKKKKIFKGVLIVSGIILLIYGSYMVYNSIVEIKTATIVSQNVQQQDTQTESQSKSSVYAPTNDFEDQNGNIINLYNYKGKYVILNFITTWCGYCKQEIPYFIEFAEKHDDEVECIYVMNSTSSKVKKEELLPFIEEEGITLPVIIDEENILFARCGISSFPTIFVLNGEGEFLGYIAGALNYEGLENLLEQIKQQ